MPMTGALAAMHTQLEYWIKEGDVARVADDAARVQQCDRFIEQCRIVIEALERAQSWVGRDDKTS